MKKICLSTVISFLTIFTPVITLAKSDIGSSVSQRSIEIESKKIIELDDILFYTYENNDELKAEREKLKAVEITKLRTLGDNTFPDLYFNSKRGRRELRSDASNRENQINNDIQVDEFVLSQPIFKSGRTKTSLNAVDNTINIQKNVLFSKEQDILYDSVIATIGLVRTEMIYDIVKQNEESLKKGYEYSQARRRVGKATVTEVYTAKSRYKEALSDTAKAKTNMLVAKANFERIAGLNPNRLKVTQIDILFQRLDKFKTSQDEIYEKALAKNPDYLAIKENYMLSKNNLSFNKTDFLPTITLNAGASRSKAYSITSKAMTRSNEGFVNLDLKVPLIQSGVKYADYKAGGYSVNQAKFEMRNAKKAIREQSIKGYEEFLLSKELIKTAEALEKATKIALDASMEESKVGKINIIDLLDRRKEYFDSQIGVINAKSSNITTYYSLKVLTGEMNLTKLEIHKNDNDR